jgi:Flp pilus assembly protein TadD
MYLVSLRQPPRAWFTLLALTLPCALLLCALDAPARAQAIGAHRGEVAGTGGSFSIQGHIVSPLGKLPETRIRIMLEHTDTGTRSTVAGEDGSFFFNNLEGGSYRLTIDAGKEYELDRESVYIEGGQPTYNVPVYLRLKPEANPALAGVPQPAVDSFMKAQEAIRKGNGKKAIELLSAAVSQHPQFGMAYGELGIQYLKTGQLDKAIEAFQSALKLMPDDPNVQLNYGIALAEKKDYPAAETQLRAALNKINGSASAHMYLGVALLGLKRNDEAEPELQQAIKLGGDQMGVAHKYLGGIYWGRRDFKHAADELEMYVNLVPKASDAERIRGTIKEMRSQK